MSKIKTLSSCAMLCALAVVLARWLSINPAPGVRISIETVPIFLAGMLFGPIAGMLVGFASDLLGSLMQFGFNPLFCLPPILYGLSGGLFRPVLRKNCNILNLSAAFLPPVVLGSILYQSATLAYVYGEGAFWPNYFAQLGGRSIQFAIVLAVDVAIIWLLYRSRLFQRAGLMQGRTGK